MLKLLKALWVLVIFYVPAVNAETIEGTLVKKPRTAVPVYQYIPCPKESREALPIEKALQGGENISCSPMTGCMLNLTYDNNQQFVQYHERQLNGQCVIKNTKKLHKFDASTYQTSLKLNKKTFGIQSLRDIRSNKTKLGYIYAKTSYEDFLQLEIVYSKKPTFDEIDFDNNTIRVNFK